MKKMIEFTAPQEAQDRIAELFTELHQVCSEHNLPYIAGVITANSATGQTRALSALLDGAAGIAPSSFVAAQFMMTQTNVPAEIIDAIIQISEPHDGCDCPACQAIRGVDGSSHLH